MNKRKITNVLLAIIVVALVAIMGAATFVQRTIGPEMAAAKIYHSGWFIALWVALVGVMGCVVCRNKMWRNPAQMALHISLAVILIGALTSFASSQRYELSLGIGETSTETPFAVTLDDSRMIVHTGTESAKNYQSILTISDPDGTSRQMTVSVNHIGRHGSYRFCQMGYTPEGGATILVTRDPWGIGITYTGFVLLIVSFAAMLLHPQGRYRKILKQLSAVLLLACAVPQAQASPSCLSRQQAQEMGRLYVNYHGRICPLETVAYHVTRQLYGSTHYQGLTAEQVLSGWMLYPNEWIEEPTRGGKHIDDQRALQQALAEGSLFRIFPIADSTGKGGWYASCDRLPEGISHEEYLFVRHFLGYCQEEAFLGHDENIDTLMAKMARFQQTRAQGELPSAGRVMAERGWNRLSNIKPMAVAVTVVGLLLFVYCLIAMARGRKTNGLVMRLGRVVGIVVSGYLLVLLALRWVAQGYLPLTNGYETMLFMALALSVMAWAFCNRVPIMLPGGLLMAGLSLMVSMMSGGDQVLEQIMPVLQSPLLCIHVSVIMLSYTLLSFVMMIGAVALACREEVQKRLHTLSLALLYPAVFLLAAGIVIGSVWANISWGCYWGWDPKEVWALITLMCYCVPLHPGLAGKLSQPRRHHLYCLVAFFTVLITYFGVNLLLGGMHSYAGA